MKIHAYVKRLAGMTLWLLAAPAVLILSAEDTPLKKISVEEYQDKVYGSWLAQCIGNVYGLPHENDYIEEPGSISCSTARGCPLSGQVSGWPQNTGLLYEYPLHPLRV